MTHNALDRFCEITINILLSWVNALECLGNDKSGGKIAFLF